MRNASRKQVRVNRIGLIILMIGASMISLQSAIAQPSAESIVSETRRTIRQACKELKLAQADSVTRQNHMDTAMRLTSSSQSMWLEFLADTTVISNSGYANHPAWVDSTAIISQGITRMAELIQQGSAMDAVKSCGSGCKRFFRLNELAGVHRSSDDLFRVRMVLKQIEPAVKEAHFTQIETSFPEILDQMARTDGPLSGGTGEESEIRVALTELKSKLAAIRDACQSQNSEALQASYQEALKAWNIAYGLLL